MLVNILVWRLRCGTQKFKVNILYQNFVRSRRSLSDHREPDVFETVSAMPVEVTKGAHLSLTLISVLIIISPGSVNFIFGDIPWLEKSSTLFTCIFLLWEVPEISCLHSPKNFLRWKKWRRNLEIRSGRNRWWDDYPWNDRFSTKAVRLHWRG